MADNSLFEIAQGVREGRVVPYLGAGALSGSVNRQTGVPIPADSDSLILAMNNGQPMAPRLMYEFPRAAMHLELKRGRKAVNDFISELYSKNDWTTAPLHATLSALKPPYLIDTNRDTQLQEGYSDTPHTLITGVSRIGGTEYRFKIFAFNGESYSEIAQEAVDETLPILFKPMGSPLPEPNYIASDADYVDYITELMGGFAIPSFLKRLRMGKQYVLLGMRLTRDTQRMVLSDIIYGAEEPKGWALIPDPNDKERRFCKRLGITIIEADSEDFIQTLSTQPNGGKYATSHVSV